MVKRFQEKYSTFTLVGFEEELTLLDAAFGAPANVLDPILGNSTLLGLQGRMLNILQQIVEAI